MICKKVFLITPYLSDNNYSKKIQIVRNVCIDYNFIFSIASEYNPNNDQSIEDTIKQIRRADLIIADLTYERPSCYYEVGYAQALKKKIILIAENSTIIHQVSGKVINYNTLRKYKIIIRDFFNSLAD